MKRRESIETQIRSVTKCEKGDKAYAERVHGVLESERGFEHLTEHENMVVSGDGHSLLR